MKHVLTMFCPLLALALLLSGAGGGSDPPSESSFRLDEPMPEFTAQRAEAPFGSMNSSELKGKAGAIIFWRPTQVFSIEAIQNLAEVVSELGSDRLNIVAVDTASSTSETVAATLRNLSFPYPAVIDPQRDLYRAFSVIVSPTTYLFDRDGVVRYKIASHPRQYRQLVQARLRFLLDEIDEEKMNQEISPVINAIDEELAASWRIYHLGNRLESEGHLSEAVAEYEKSIARNPSLSEARCALGFIALAGGAYDIAREHFQMALNYQPASTTARLGQAAVLARTGSAAQAEQILIGLLDHRAVGVRVRYELGRIYRNRGEYDKAAALFEDALAMVYPEAQTQVSFDRSALTTSSQETTPPTLSSAASTVAPGAPAVLAVQIPDNANYLGLQKCKKCHFKQWQTWKETRMASAFELLKPGVEPTRKERHGLDPARDYTGDESCLRCHTTGFGHSGGYAPGGAASDLQGVTCESCHGPGGFYIAIHEGIQDEQRNYRQSDLLKVGQFDAGPTVCAGCHDTSAPCIDPNSTFDYATRKNQGTHWHADLRLRSR